MIYHLLFGLLGVCNMILWGLYGDLLVEKFEWFKVLRSIVFALFWSALLFFIHPQLPLFIVALVVICLERITTEIYKLLIRVEDQKKYKIPSDLKINLSKEVKIVLGLLIIIA